MEKKCFIITIDTEGDNLWSYRPQMDRLLIPETQNALYLPRFQQLCEKYEFYPTYFVDYEMVKRTEFVEFGKDIIKRNKGEIGMHMHAFSTPPFYKLTNLKGKGLSYAGEYPGKILYQKMEYMTKTLQDIFQVRISSHRGGRWYINNRILKILDRLGYSVDCTITPGINWNSTKGQTKKSHGNDYSHYKSKIYQIRGTSMWELPVTIMSRVKINEEGSDRFVQRQKIWMRPNGRNLDDMIWIVNEFERNSVGYIEFMLHSSELMVNGNPIFRTDRDIERLYSHMDILFAYLKERGYKGIGCSKYVEDKAKTQNRGKCM